MYLVQTSSDGTAQAVRLDGDTVTIGRERDNDLVLSDPLVSRHHARIFRTPGGWRIVDLGGKNGLLLNDRPVSEADLSEGDRITIGSSVFHFATTPSAGAPAPAAGHGGPADPSQATVVVPGWLPGTTPAPSAEGTRLEALVTMLGGIASAPDETALAHSILSEVMRIFGASRGFIGLSVEGRVEPLAMGDLDAPPESAPFTVSRTIAARILAERIGLLTEDAVTDDRLAGADSILASGVRSAMAAPVYRRGETAGILYVDHRRECGRFRADDLRLFIGVANLVSAALDSVAVRRAADRERQRLRQALDGGRILIGHSAFVQNLRRSLARIAVAPGPVLLLGETGTGKDLVARLVHETSPRGKGPFVTVNCAALPAALVENELFGHVKGAYSGAFDDRMGALQEARGGTLFLDEIGDMPLDLQPKLLHAIENGSIRRLGSTEPETVDVRIVAATNRDVEVEVRSGGFRSDLYYRLKAFELRLPPLRERTEDILPLAKHFLALDEVSGGRALLLSSEAQNLLLRHPWPGNVRELRNTLERAAALATSDTIGPSLIGAAPAEERTRSLRDVERDHLLRVLTANQWNISLAARCLEIQRNTLYGKMRKHNILRGGRHAEP